MITEQTDEQYLVISDEIGYAKTATEAVQKAGIPRWSSAIPANEVRKMLPGDEMSIGPNNSIIRITGKDTTLTW